MLTMIDTRLGFKIVQGLAINFGFEKKEGLETSRPSEP